MSINLLDEFKLQEGGKSVVQTIDSPGTLISLITNNILIVASIILFFFILIGGLTMILNAGDSDKQKQGMQTITNAIVGYLIVFAAYWIIRIIEGLTGLQILAPNL